MVTPNRRTRQVGAKRSPRPVWQKVAGVGLMLVGVALAIVNSASKPNGSHEVLRLLPGGYNLLYIPLAIGFAASGGWSTGAFDRRKGSPFNTPRRGLRTIVPPGGPT